MNADKNLFTPAAILAAELLRRVNSPTNNLSDAAIASAFEQAYWAIRLAEQRIVTAPPTDAASKEQHQ